MTAPAGPGLTPQAGGAGRSAARSRVRRDGFAAVAPVLPGILAWGVVTGVAMVKSGLSVWQALAMSLVVYSGTAQLATLPLIATGAGLAVVWATALLANLRFVVYSATAAPLFRRLPPRQRAAVGYLLIDSGLAVFQAARRQRGYPTSRLRLFQAVNLPIYAVWHLGSIVGIVAAPWIPGDQRLGFVGILAIAALVGPMLRGAAGPDGDPRPRRAVLGGALVAAIVAILLVALPHRLGMFAAIVAGVAASFLIERRREAPATHG